MGTTVEGIQPLVLSWARESQGYSVQDVAKKLKLKPEVIESWEKGTSFPTYPQLEKMAYKIYKRPLAAFFLPSPPAEATIKKKFRSLPDTDLEELEPDTRYQLRLAQSFQISLMELNEDHNPAKKTIFKDLTFSSNQNINKAAADLRNYLGVTIDKQFSWNSDDEAMKEWRNIVEDCGVYVFKHSFKQKSISGFCLLDNEFPIIYLNNSTSKTRQIFSLFHELVHLLIGVNAITKLDDSYINYLSAKEKHIEIFCNAVTAEFLIPSDDFSRMLRKFSTTLDDANISFLSKRYSVSREVILRRLLDKGFIDNSFYQIKLAEYSKAFHKTKRTGGKYYATQAAYLGEKYLKLVFGKHYQGKLSIEQVADYLGVKSKNISGLETYVLNRTATE